MCCWMGVSCAVACGVLNAFISLGFTLLAFITPHWLENNGYQDNPQFEKLGLWEMCFKDFRSRHSFYERDFAGCRWVLDPHLADIDYYIRPRFYVVTQLFYTGALLFAGVAVLLSLCAMFCVGYRREARVLTSVAVVNFCAAVCSTVSVVVFAIFGGSRDWMPDWQNNNFSWSFISACIGTVLLYLGVILFWVQARRVYKLFSVGRPTSHRGYQLTSQV